MKIKWNKWGANWTQYYDMHLAKYQTSEPVATQMSPGSSLCVYIGYFDRIHGAPSAQRYGFIFDGQEYSYSNGLVYGGAFPEIGILTSRLINSSFVCSIFKKFTRINGSFIIDTMSAHGKCTAEFSFCVFSQCDNWFSNGPGRVEFSFRNCTFYRCDCSTIPDRASFLECCFIECVPFESPDAGSHKIMYVKDCVSDSDFSNNVFLPPDTDGIKIKKVGRPLFVSTNIEDFMSNPGTFDEYCYPQNEGVPYESINNPLGQGFHPITEWFGYDYTYKDGFNFLPLCWWTSGQPLIPVGQTWQPSYACDESKRMVLFNNQDYIDLDGERRNYFDKVITEITLDFTKNGLTKEDMAAVKDIYENSDNEITIYPDENNTSNYIVGRLSKADLDYSKMINSYWDNGKIDNERFNGIRMVIRVTDDTHFTGGV